MADLAKRDFYRRLGYAGPEDLLHQALLEAGLTNPRKSRISLDKLDAAALVLEERFLRACSRGDCQDQAIRLLADRPGQELALAAEARDCAMCGGSGTSRAVKAMVAAMGSLGWTRLCVVGGSPSSHGRLRLEVGQELELRLVEGTRSRTLQQARADTRWAHCTVIWGATLLDHRVSDMYRGLGCVLINGRGIEELAAEVERHVRLRSVTP
jgi:hypothetical protein